MTTKTLRLPESLASAVRNVGRSEDIDESVAMRKLLQMGYRTYLAEHYRQGRITLRTVAKELGLSMGDALDALSRMGITGNVSADDTLHAFRSLSPRRS